MQVHGSILLCLLVAVTDWALFFKFQVRKLPICGSFKETRD